MNQSANILPSPIIPEASYWKNLYPIKGPIARFFWKYWPILVCTYLILLAFSYVLDDIATVTHSQVSLWDYLTGQTCIDNQCSSFMTNVVDNWRLFIWFILLSGIPISLNRWQRRIPAFFQRAAIQFDAWSDPSHAKRYLEILGQYEKRLKNKMRYVIAIGFALLTVTITYSAILIDKTRRHISTDIFNLPFSSFTDPHSYAGLLRYVLDITYPPGGLITLAILASISIIYIWPVIVTGLTMRQFPHELAIVVDPDHPDQCGGLRFVGTFSFYMALPMVIGSVLVGLLAGDFIHEFTPEIQSAIFAALLLLIIPSATFSFLLPLWTYHRAMDQQRHAYEDKIYPQITALRSSMLRALRAHDIESARRINADLSLYQAVQPRRSDYPVWPFDRELFIGLFFPQLLSILGPITSFWPLGR
jgi:hypothetical protein